MPYLWVHCRAYICRNLLKDEFILSLWSVLLCTRRRHINASIAILDHKLTTRDFLDEKDGEESGKGFAWLATSPLD